jgi:NADPH-dependent glutamate synthase beta subunit-like oxidoreductase/NAD(P)H-flavin reductase
VAYALPKPFAVTTHGLNAARASAPVAILAGIEMEQEHELRLADGLAFAELFRAEGIRLLDERFQAFLEEREPLLRRRLADYRAATALDALQTSELLLALAPHVEDFLARLFGIGAAVDKARAATLADNEIQVFKKQFVQRRSRRFRGELAESFAELDQWLDAELERAGLTDADRERAVSRYAVALLEDTKAHAQSIDQLTRWCVLARREPAGRRRVAGWPSFKLPLPLDPAQLVPLEYETHEGARRFRAPTELLRRRDGFALTDRRMSARAVQDEVHYCVYCHDHDGDFCSKGFPEKKDQPELGFRKNPLGVALTGCPLEEKISEMHALKRDGYSIAALAVAMADNPMLPATGHRICNDCMKGCIYQKQTPVNIPQIETRVLTDVLSLPWGVEIYDLLTRWNPLRATQYRMLPYSGRKVLVSGMGPAGFTMAHHLTMEGCAVVGIDGLKIEPLPDELLNRPVRDYAMLEETLDERIILGFGGVAEYGITVRWDKNFLKLIYLSLARRATFQVFGGVRLGGTVTLDDAWALGFDHVCIANGAGLPHVIPIGESLARGMRQANDFLMALQLTGAAKRSSLANLQVRMPAVVIGGGLTAIDTATEVQAYYIAQVEKTLARYDTLAETYGEGHVEHRLNEEQRGILAEFLAHGREVRAERERAAAACEPPDFVPLLRRWGGVTLLYRRSMRESPAYLRNHEEIAEALREGLYYIEAVEPTRVELDEHGHVQAIVCHRRTREDGWWVAGEDELHLPARAVFAAAGATPNTIYEREYPGTFKLQGNHFQPHALHDHDLEPMALGGDCKAAQFGPFTSYAHDGRRVSFIGDTHPVFHGSVVKAIASAKRSYPEIMMALADQPAAGDADYADFALRVRDLLSATVDEVRTDQPGVVELWVRAPLAARNYRPGQFFRLQTFESLSPLAEDTRLQIPLQTVSGTGIEGERVRLMVLKAGPNPRLVERLKPGDPLVLMGPTGAPADIEPNRTVLVIAGKWGAAVMLDLGPAVRAAGGRVLMFAAFGSAREVYHKAGLEAATDQIVWCAAPGEDIPAGRSQDLSTQGSDVLTVLRRYADDELAPSAGTRIPLSEVDEIYVMGSTGLLRELKQALRGELKSAFRQDVKVVGTVGSPMQCMLKGVCAQCVQWQVDPETGKRTEPVFSCAMQDQPLFAIDLDNLAARQTQNRLAEHLTSLWLDHVLKATPQAR